MKIMKQWRARNRRRRERKKIEVTRRKTEARREGKGS